MERQADLLTILDPGPMLTPAMREALIPMVASLLLEAIAEPVTDMSTEAVDSEGDDEQDLD